MSNEFLFAGFLCEINIHSSESESLNFILLSHIQVWHVDGWRWTSKYPWAYPYNECHNSSSCIDYWIYGQDRLWLVHGSSPRWYLVLFRHALSATMLGVGFKSLSTTHAFQVLMVSIIVMICSWSSFLIPTYVFKPMHQRTLSWYHFSSKAF